MAKLRVLSGKDVCKILSNHGFMEVRIRGSHIVMQRKDAGKIITVPVPNHDELSVGTLRINEIVHGKRSISANTALRLSRFFGTTDRFWLNLQTRYDLEIEKDRLGSSLKEEVEVLK
ncbi:MAG: hypothetical protein SCARUB_01603 [Candidatus Scalindua rubra]|uniref:Addiction module antidote protein, HigA family n=1 Tax=Candidatus Scalindua rubra TaxID=1872076 RepID=A0A1E3XCC5_9BACT|nr:MAG: hypothetical protein SCARUB_01603 [Candidatus Scalindua rubra]